MDCYGCGECTLCRDFDDGACGECGEYADHCVCSEVTLDPIPARKQPLPLRIALAIGGACVAGWLGGYAVLSWYRASQEERDELLNGWLEALMEV